MKKGALNFYHGEDRMCWPLMLSTQETHPPTQKTVFRSSIQVHEKAALGNSIRDHMTPSQSQKAI